jgi:ABC-2 type transport system ATP-binding protein
VVLSNVPGISDVEPAGGRADLIVATLADAHRADEAQAHASDAMRALVDAGVPVLAFELEGARLSDAFLSMTREG